MLKAWKREQQASERPFARRPAVGRRRVLEEERHKLNLRECPDGAVLRLREDADAADDGREDGVGSQITTSVTR